MQILSKIKPNEKDKKKVKKLVNKFIDKYPKLKLELAGSLAKDTWLRNNCDIDIFVKFDYKKYKDKDISKLLKKKLGNVSTVHGSRDYYQLKKGRYVFELIPVLDIKKSKEAVNITDVSPLHAKWVKKNLKDSDQVRLAKQFCRANNLYGAESYIGGFSGYILEVLVTHYGSFIDLIKNAAEWKDKEIIDIEKYYKSKKEVLDKLNKSKISPLIIIDPVQKDRNAAAGLSEKRLKKFIKLCQEFMKKPSDNFFYESKINLRKDKVALINIKPNKGKKDSIGGKLSKFYGFIENRLNKEGFIVEESDFLFGKKAMMWFYLEKLYLDKKMRHYGPPKKDKANLEKFRNKWEGKRVFFDKGKSYVNVERELYDAKSFINDILKKNKKHFKRSKLKVY
ncbi:CCA tRNA nucleotidyltransferase [archaeon]|nr:CCA tRNA nucleotidyltransferase [archaeon]